MQRVWKSPERFEFVNSVLNFLAPKANTVLGNRDTPLIKQLDYELEISFA